jgi:hypothetical protein
MLEGWGFVLVPILAGLVLPTYIGVRVLILAFIGLGWLEVYEREFYDPGVGHTFGLMIVGALIGSFALGALVRGALRGALGPGMALPSPRWIFGVDRLLLIAAMGVPAGLTALILGAILAGAGRPVAVHVTLLAVLALTGVAALRKMTGHPRAAALGFCAFLAGIVGYSMRMEPGFQAALRQNDAPWCLSIGPRALALDQVPPLMGLTAPKPILLLVDRGNRPEVLRWSFRGRIFVEGGAPPRDIACTPASP